MFTHTYVWCPSDMLLRACKDHLSDATYEDVYVHIELASV